MIKIVLGDPYKILNTMPAGSYSSVFVDVDCVTLTPKIDYDIFKADAPNIFIATLIAESFRVLTLDGVLFVRIPNNISKRLTLAIIKYLSRYAVPMSEHIFINKQEDEFLFRIMALVRRPTKNHQIKLAKHYIHNPNSKATADGVATTIQSSLPLTTKSILAPACPPSSLPLLSTVRLYVHAVIPKSAVPSYITTKYSL